MTAKKPDLSYIIPQLRRLAVRCDSLNIDPKNARTHDEANLASIERSLRKFGQRIPIVVQTQGRVVRAGNGRLEVARERLRWDYIAAVVVDEADAEAAAFALTDNRSGELAGWNWARLAETLQELKIEMPAFDVGDLGWTQEEIDGLSLAGEWDDVDPEGDSVKGNPANPRGGVIVLKFNEQEAQRLATVMRNAGHDEVSVETVLSVLETAHC